MPLYEYKCEKCGNVFETLQKYSDAPLTVHEGCGGALEKLLSASAFSLKGSGWYVTDYGRGGSKPEAKSDGKSESKSDGKSDTKSESKSESKSEGSEKKSESKPSSESKTESKPAPASKPD
jgi:putative FmdB family regulatory protein